MGPKKKAAGEGEVEGEDPTVLASNYSKYCKLVGLAPCTAIIKALNDEEAQPVESIIVSGEDTSASSGDDPASGGLGPGGTRALMTAILGTGPGMKGGPYKLLKNVRLWRARCGDDGAAAIAEVLRLGGAEVKLQYLELIDNGIGPRGAAALGASLCGGCNRSLLTLNLDHNASLGSDGFRALCRGLRTNASLRQLHVSYCKIDGTELGSSLVDLLSNATSALAVLNLTGNHLRAEGLVQVCRGLRVNGRLESLVLADNGIDAVTPEDVSALEALRDALLMTELDNAPGAGAAAEGVLTAPALSSVDLSWNRIGERGGNILLPALAPSNKRISEFLVDVSLPLPLFEALSRRGGGGGKKKGKKGKKK